MFSDDDIRAYAAAKAKAEKAAVVEETARRIAEKIIWEEMQAELNKKCPVYKQREPGEDRPKIIGLEAIFDIEQKEDND